MDLTSGRAWLALSALSLLACSPKSPSPQEESSVSAISSQTIAASMSLPSGMISAGLLVGQTNIQLDSNIVVPGPVWGGGGLYMQPDVKVQAAIVNTGNVVLADRDTLTSLAYGGTLTQGNGNSIGSAIHASLTNTPRSVSVTFPATTISHIINSGRACLSLLAHT